MNANFTKMDETNTNEYLLPRVHLNLLLRGINFYFL